nr:MAG TPA: hypothetical protein [Caudoviricetes sp.]
MITKVVFIFSIKNNTLRTIWGYFRGCIIVID